jgi:hypothetical protein
MLATEQHAEYTILCFVTQTLRMLEQVLDHLATKKTHNTIF